MTTKKLTHKSGLAIDTDPKSEFFSLILEQMGYKTIDVKDGAGAIVSSDYSNDPILANYKDYGFSGVLPKPFTTDQVAEVLNKIFNSESESE